MAKRIKHLKRSTINGDTVKKAKRIWESDVVSLWQISYYKEAKLLISSFKDYNLTNNSYYYKLNAEK